MRGATMPQKKPLLFVPIETKVREFHGKLLFSLAAAERGFEVLLGGQEALVEGVAALGRGIYLDKSISESKTKWFQRCRALGNSICAWDEEGLVVFDDETYRDLRFCEESFDQTDLFFAWGEVQAHAPHP